MNNYNILFLVLGFVFVLLILFIIYYSFNRYRVNKINKRIDKFSLKNDNSFSFFDLIYTKFYDFIADLNSLFKRIKIFDEISRRYSNVTSDGYNIVSYKFILGIIVSLIMGFYTFEFYYFVLGFLIGFFLIDLKYLIIRKKNNNKIDNDLLNAISVMNNCFKSGHSIVQSIDIVSNEIDGVIGREFSLVSRDLKYGLSLEESFNRFYDRTHISEVKYIASSLTIVNSTGGDIVGVFSSIEDDIYINKKLNDELNSMSSSSRFLSKVLIVLPILLILGIVVIDFGYFLPLFTNVLGYLIILFILILYIVYIILVKRIIRV